MVSVVAGKGIRHPAHFDNWIVPAMNNARPLVLQMWEIMHIVVDIHKAHSIVISPLSSPAIAMLPSLLGSLEGCHLQMIERCVNQTLGQHRG